MPSKKVIGIVKLIFSVALYIFIAFWTFFAYGCSELAIESWGAIDEDVLLSGMFLGYINIILSVMYYLINFRKKVALILVALAVIINIYSLIKLGEIASLLPPSQSLSRIYTDTLV